MERAILARHGESVFNVLNVANGDAALPGGLTPLGYEQAAVLREALRDERLQLCVTSEFERARTTADEVLARMRDEMWKEMAAELRSTAKIEWKIEKP